MKIYVYSHYYYITPFYYIYPNYSRFICVTGKTRKAEGKEFDVEILARKLSKLEKVLRYLQIAFIKFYANEIHSYFVIVYYNGEIYPQIFN